MTCPPFRHCVFPRSARRAGGAVVLAAILPGWAAAQTGAIPETPAVPGSAMLQMLLGLALVIGLLFVGAYLLRRLNGGKAFGNTGPLRVVGGLLYLTGALIMTANLWLTVTRGEPKAAANVAAAPAE